MEGQKNKKQSFIDRMRSFFAKNDLLLPVVSDYRIEMHGKKRESRALVSGARRILICNSERIVLETKGERLCFNGIGLECLCYERGIAEIYGTIHSFSFDGEMDI